MVWHHTASLGQGLMALGWAETGSGCVPDLSQGAGPLPSSLRFGSLSVFVSHPLANTHQLSPLKPKSKISPEPHTVGGLAAPAPLPLSLHVSGCKTHTPVELFLESPACVHADIKPPHHRAMGGPRAGCRDALPSVQPGHRTHECREFSTLLLGRSGRKAGKIGSAVHLAEGQARFQVLKSTPANPELQLGM